MLKVRNEQEKEKQIRKKEAEYKEIVARMAEKILNENEDVLGKETVEMAKAEITGKDKKQESNNKEEKTNEQKKVKRAGRPRKTA